MGLDFGCFARTEPTVMPEVRRPGSPSAFPWSVATLIISFSVVRPVEAQTLDPTVYIVFDTSASMLLNAEATVSCGGDGSTEHPHAAGCVSRLYMAKNALSSCIFGFPEVRWGLARFHQTASWNLFCTYQQGSLPPASVTAPCSAALPGSPWELDIAGNPVCVISAEFMSYAYSHDLAGNDRMCINYLGDCNGADVLVATAESNELQILSWVNHQEPAGQFFTDTHPLTGDHCWDSVNQIFGDCELRGTYSTPLGASLQSLYDQISQIDLDSDTRRGCRPYVIVLLTDGDESCGGDPSAVAASLRQTPDINSTCASNADCPTNSWCNTGTSHCTYDVLTYVIGFNHTSTALDAIALSGGTASSISATDEDDIVAAMADIIANAIHPELCNGVDDNCDGLVDEAFPVGQACTNGGLGICREDGTYACDPADDTRVMCAYSLTPIEPGTQPEICDGLDNDCDGEVDEGGICICNGPELCNGVDDYCDNWATHAEGSEDSRVNEVCGTDLGACVAGMTYCDVGGTISCSGTSPQEEVCDADVPENDQNCNGVNNDGVVPRPCSNNNAYGTCFGSETCNTDGTWTCWAATPAPEVCNNLDDNCDGMVDQGIVRPCVMQNSYGICQGTQACVAGAWMACSAMIPCMEVCDGLDNDCNGQADGLTEACYDEFLGGCAETSPGEFACCGSCHAGIRACPEGIGSWGSCLGALYPQPEICNDLDDDCDGMIDEGEVGDPLAQACYSGPPDTLDHGICHGGTRTCISGTWSLCMGQQTPQIEVCDGQDNDCDGFTDNAINGQALPMLSQFCQNTSPLGTCVGQQECTGTPGDLWSSCTAQMPSEEVCDGQDNNCDGIIDGLVQPCYPNSPVGGCTGDPVNGFQCVGSCLSGVEVCPQLANPSPTNAFSACLYAVLPDAEVCDGQDNDCDGYADEDDQGNPLAQACYSLGSGPGLGCMFDVNIGDWICTGECRTGLRTCTDGAYSPCQGEVMPSPEVCDGVDNDCDGQIDELEDLPGLGMPCGTSLGRCSPAYRWCQDGIMVCQGGEGPFPGECNGLDDDCDGEIDEPDELAQDSRLGLPCGEATGVCSPGQTQCAGGEVLCVGGVQPGIELCDGQDNDCDGAIDNQALCPSVGGSSTHCIEAACRPECDPESSLPCPGSLQCEPLVADGETFTVCMPESPLCGGTTCPQGYVCVSDVCTDPCDLIACEEHESCEAGECVDTSCSGLGSACPAGTICVAHVCVDDPCASALCPGPDGYCVPSCEDGLCQAECVSACPCPPDERCAGDGGCQEDLCAGIWCELGMRCEPANGTCEPDACREVQCRSRERCVDGRCELDPCRSITCPESTYCTLEEELGDDGQAVLRPYCRYPSGYWIPPGFSTRGGCDCSAQRTSDPGGLLLLFALLCMCGLRKAQRATRPSRIAVLLILLGASGCPGELHETAGYYLLPDGSLHDALVTDGGSCQPSPEVCDGLDNDCDGLIDEDFDLHSDPNNCGACGARCAPTNAFPRCIATAGEVRCLIESCFPGYTDDDGEPENGCESGCTITHGGVELCDGLDNDCDGEVDEDFFLQNNPLHCGQCFRACRFLNAEADCIDGDCLMQSCLPGFSDADQDPSNGCECQLDVTEGAIVCDPEAMGTCGVAELCVDHDQDGVYHCASLPVDACDGRDNDCDGQVDEDATAIFGGAQCYPHSMGCVETMLGVFECEGRCSAGSFSCVSGQTLCLGSVGPAGEVCDGEDNNCDGMIDEGYDKLIDPSHCGACYNRCADHVPNAASFCMNGNCEIASCWPGFHDLDLIAPGCEYACSITNAGVEKCGDGIDNNCNGVVDEGFDLQNDPVNCGACGYRCDVAGPPGTETTGCAMGACQYACLAGYSDANNDLSQGELGNGCEYLCTLTNGGMETCDGLDNDCDGVVDQGFDLQVDLEHCGGCNYRCEDHLGANSSMLGCINGVCKYTCASGWTDPNGDVSLGSLGNGCEYSCSPTNGGVEICDNHDNDCDGLVDEAPNGLPLTEACYTGEPATRNIGTCSDGTSTCSGGMMGACLGEVLPVSDTCDLLDNDCNGTPDDGCNLFGDFNNCGTIGFSCSTLAINNAYAYECWEGICQLACMPGYNDLDGDLQQGSSGNGCEYACPVYPPVEEYCDGLDNDCDGQIDEGLTAPIGFCYQGIDGPGPSLPGSDENNPCHGVIPVCEDPDGTGPLPHSWYCHYSTAVEVSTSHPGTLLGYELLCNGKDGDCDGVQDDSFNAGQPCDDGGIGQCRGTGTYHCSFDQLFTECLITSPGWIPTDEVCDGVDNDCDGLTDEPSWENIPANEPAGISVGYVADDLVTITTPSGLSAFVYRYEASHPTATYTSGGLGSAARACSRPDVIPWANVTWRQAAEACSMAGMHLCRVHEWFEACNGTPGSLAFPYGNTYNGSACNGHDTDPTQDEVAPTGTQQNCDSFGYGIADLSGNLREWTDDFVSTTTEAKRVFALRGGSFRDLSEGLRCDFVHAAYVEDSLAPHIGFRCCSTCGNGTIEPWETCDPMVDPTNCHPAHCGPLTCGDGTMDASELCDDGNLVAGDGCSPACQTETSCGDGVPEGDEECDDGNSQDFDGCSSLCTTETTVVLETFATCPAAGWLVVDGGGSGTWTCLTTSNNTGSPSGGGFHGVVSQAVATCDDGLVTPSVDLSAFVKVQLGFYHSYYDLAPMAGDYGEVQVSLNGQAGPWISLDTFVSCHAGRVVLDASGVAAGQANVAFRFNYVHGATSDDYWQVDDISIKAY